MKKFTLLAVASLIAATSTFAQQGRQSENRQQAPALNRQQAAQTLTRQPRSQQSQHAELRDRHLATQPATPQPRRIAQGVADQPAGTLRDGLVASFQGLAYSWWGGWQNISSDASPASIVEGTDGNLYIKGLTPSFYGDAYWVTAEPTGEANRYVIHRQEAGVYPYYDETDYISRLVYSDEDGDFVEADNTDLFLTYQDGVLTLDPAEIDESGLPSFAYGLLSDYYGDLAPDASYGYYWNTVIKKLDQEITELPEGAQTETLILQHQEGAKDVQVAFVGDKIYVQSYSTVPGWYVGTVSGDKVTFKNGQFLGYDTNYDSYQWLVTGHTYEAWDEDYEEYYLAGEITDEVVFDYDAAAKRLTAVDADDALFINGAVDRIYYAERYIGPKFYPFTEKAAVPATPEITYFWDYDDSYESAEIDFEIQPFDVDGEYILSSKLTYSIFVDGELFEFEPDEYTSFSETVTEIPYNYDADYNIGTTWLALLFQPAENVGIQAIYRGAGVENRSDIFYYDVNTGETYVEPYDNTITAISSTGRQQQATAVYFDAAGRRVKADAKGLLLKTVTLADGTQKTYKVVRK